MRESDPFLENSFIGRVRARGFRSLTAEIFAHPIRTGMKLKDRIYETRHPDEPLLAPGAIRFLESRVVPSWQVFEWGPGNSTVWFAARCEKVTSVEHNPQWRDAMLSRLRDSHAEVDLRFVPLDHDPSERTVPVYPTVPAYVAAVDDVDDGSLDLVLVDGHYRQACVAASVGKLRPGGLLVVDDTHWLSGDEWGVPRSWKRVCLATTGWKETSIFEVPIMDGGNLPQPPMSRE